MSIMGVSESSESPTSRADNGLDFITVDNACDVGVGDLGRRQAAGASSLQYLDASVSQ